MSSSDDSLYSDLSLRSLVVPVLLLLSPLLCIWALWPATPSSQEESPPPPPPVVSSSSSSVSR